MARIPDCHPDRKHQGRGLCRSCYMKEWGARNVSRGQGRVYTYSDLTGQRFGNWVVIDLAEGRCRAGGMLWLCECQCEARTQKVRSNSCLVRGKSNQSCGCKDKKKLRPYEALYRRLKYDNKWNRRSREIAFSYEEFLTLISDGACHYCNTQVEWTKWNLTNGSGYHLDRKDNNLSYTMENCVVCCERCNKAKREWFSYEEWYGMTTYLRERNANAVK